MSGNGRLACELNDELFGQPNISPAIIQLKWLSEGSVPTPSRLPELRLQDADICIDMCIDACIDTCIDMYKGICVGMHLGICLCMRLCMCLGMHLAMCLTLGLGI